MKKFFAFALIFAAFTLVACGGEQKKDDKKAAQCENCTGDCATCDQECDKEECDGECAAKCDKEACADKECCKKECDKGACADKECCKKECDKEACADKECCKKECDKGAC